MPFDRSQYPENWDAIALRVKEAADWTCQKCGRPCRRPGESVEDFEWKVLDIMMSADKLPSDKRSWMDASIYKDVVDECGMYGQVFKSQQFTLTVSHVKHHDTQDPNAKLWALCSVCHLEYDRPHRTAFRYKKLEKNGQGNLFAQ